MKRFVVTIEDTAGSSLGIESDPIEHALSSTEMRAYIETRAKEGTLPSGVVGLIDAHTAPDDSIYENGRDEDDDVKLFVSIGLVVEAEDFDDAEDMTIPEAMLNEIAAMLGDDLDLEGNWEILEVVDHRPYLIRSTEEAETYWSNQDGWVDIESATEFTDEERHSLNLPMGGEWLQVEPNKEAIAPSI